MNYGATLLSGIDPVAGASGWGKSQASLGNVVVVVVGIVKDMKQDDSIQMVSPTFSDQSINNRHYARGRERVARTPLPASLLESQIRKEIQTLDPALPVFNVHSMKDLMDASIAPRRFSAELVGVFAPSRCFISIGIYGLLLTWLGRGLVRLESESPWSPAA